MMVATYCQFAIGIGALPHRSTLFDLPAAKRLELRIRHQSANSTKLAKDQRHRLLLHNPTAQALQVELSHR